MVKASAPADPGIPSSMPTAPAVSGAPSPVARTNLDGIALLTIDNPPINAINAAVRTALLAELDRIEQDPDVAGVVIAAHGRLFSGGGDLREIGKPEPEDAVTMTALARRIEWFAKPVVVAIGGRAIGGGILMALACHARVGTAAASIALPEVNLGFVPGAGGTQRLPRLVGAETALRMIVLAAPLGGEAAFAAGFFDLMADSAGLIPAAAACCADIAAGRRPWRRTGQLPVAPLEPAVRAALQERFRSEAQKAFPLREAPLAAVELVLDADADFDAGLARERAAFLRLSTGSQARALLHQFFAARTGDA